MILNTHLGKHTTELMLDLGEQMFNESRFGSLEVYDRLKCTQLLSATQTHPSNYFLVYGIEDEQIKGFIILGIAEHYFSTQKNAQDYAVYVAPEKRGSSLFIRMMREAETWARVNGAENLVINHNTGIHTEDSVPLFNRLGFNKEGYIFSKKVA